MAEITVKATAPGYFGGPRAKGEVFQVPAGSKGKWFTETVEAVGPAPKAVPQANKPVPLRSVSVDDIL